MYQNYNGGRHRPNKFSQNISNFNNDIIRSNNSEIYSGINSIQNVCKSSFKTTAKENENLNNYLKQESQRLPFENDSICSKPNDNNSTVSDKMFTNEIKLIPRNQINAFKAFRNSTFRLVPSSSPNQGLIINSNNSNRCSNQKSKAFTNGSNNAGNSHDSYIDKINKRIMLKKITELATPYNTTRNEILKPFQRIIPHPIIDDKIFKLNDNSSFLEQNNDFTDSDKEDSSLIVTKTKLLCHKKQNNSELSKEDLSKIENYESILINKLKRIKCIKNEQREKSDNQSVLVYCYNNSPTIEGKINNSTSDTMMNQAVMKQNLKDDFLINKESYDLDFTKNAVAFKGNHSFSLNMDPISKTEHALIEQKENIYIKKLKNQNLKNHYKEFKDENHNDFSNKESEYNKPNKVLMSEIEVCVDDDQNSFNFPAESYHIPLYFQYYGSKKFKFKLKSLSRIYQAQKAFCSRMNIKSSDLIFTTESGRVIGSSDTPFSLDLKPHDVIIVTNN